MLLEAHDNAPRTAVGVSQCYWQAEHACCIIVCQPDHQHLTYRRQASRHYRQAVGCLVLC